MASQGPNYAGTVVDAGGGVFSWTNPGNAATSDGVFATASSGNDQDTNYLRWTNFNFSIPSNATINGIVFEISDKASALGATDWSVLIIKNGSITGTNQSIGRTVSATQSTTTYGSSSSLWGATFLYSDINSPDFGVEISYNVTPISSKTISVDFGRLTIYYTLSGSSTIYSQAMTCSL